MVERAETRSAAEVIGAVLRVTQIGRRSLIGPCRYRPYVEARHATFWLLRRHTALSTVRIGAMIGRRDHSTVRHGIEVVDGDPQRFEGLLTKVAKSMERGAMADR